MVGCHNSVTRPGLGFARAVPRSCAGRSMRPYGKFKGAGETPALRKAALRCVRGCAQAGANPICGAVYVGWVDEENVGRENVPLE
jgi:hypothetical protein